MNLITEIKIIVSRFASKMFVQIYNDDNTFRFKLDYFHRTEWHIAWNAVDGFAENEWKHKNNLILIKKLKLWDESEHSKFWH